MRETPNLLLKLPDLTDYVNVEDLNENFTKLDTEIAKITDEETGVEAKLAEHLTDNVKHITPTERTNWNNKLNTSDLKDASTSQKGILQLIDSYTSTDVSKAPTAKALKSAYDALIGMLGVRAIKGTLTGEGTTEGSTRTVQLGVTPVVVFLFNRYSSDQFAWYMISRTTGCYGLNRTGSGTNVQAISDTSTKIITNGIQLGFNADRGGSNVDYVAFY